MRKIYSLLVITIVLISCGEKKTTSIEEIVSKSYTINKYKTSLDLSIEKAIDMMMLDNPKNKIMYEDISKKPLKVDLELFALAIKNLLDNGIKYSLDKKVKK